jgi:hypothetical protein
LAAEQERHDDGVILAAGSLSARLPGASSLASLLRAFDSALPRSADDEVPSQAVAVAGTLIHAQGPKHALLLSESRVLIPSSPPLGGQALFGIPVSDGQVCYVNGNGTALGCASNLTDGLAWNVQFARNHSLGSVAVFGLVANEVEAVEVRNESGTETPATLGHNAFYWTAEGSAIFKGTVTGLVLRWKSGAETFVQISLI